MAVLLEAVLWVFIAAALCFVGDGRNDLISIVLYDPRVTRQTNPKHEVSSQVVEKVVAAGGSVSLLAALAAFTAGIWPVYGFLAPFVVLVISFGILMSLHFVPSIGFLAVHDQGHEQPLTKPAAAAVGPTAAQETQTAP